MPLDQSQVAKIDQPISSAQRIQPTRKLGGEFRPQVAAIVFLPRDATQSAVMRLHVVRLSVCDDQVPCSNRFEFF